MGEVETQNIASVPSLFPLQFWQNNLIGGIIDFNIPARVLGNKFIKTFINFNEIIFL